MSMMRPAIANNREFSLTETLGNPFVRGIARYARDKISGGFALAPVQQREYGALRVGAVNDPGAARHGSWAIEDLAAAGLHALRRRLDVVNVEIVEPEGKRQCRRLRKHAAEDLPISGKLLIRTDRTSVGSRFLPAE